MASDDLLTKDEAKRFLGIGGNDNAKDSLLQSWITGASRALAKKCGPIVYGSITAEAHNGGDCYVYLDYAPVVSVSQVVEYDYTTAGTLTAESNSSKPAAGYRVDLESGKITRRNANYTQRFPQGEGNVVVTYVAGRYASTAAVDDRFKTACGLVLQNAWRPYEDVVGVEGDFALPKPAFPSFAIPKAAKEELADEWRAGSGIGE